MGGGFGSSRTAVGKRRRRRWSVCFAGRAFALDWGVYRGLPSWLARMDVRRDDPPFAFGGGILACAEHAPEADGWVSEAATDAHGYPTEVDGKTAPSGTLDGLLGRSPGTSPRGL